MNQIAILCLTCASLLLLPMSGCVAADPDVGQLVHEDVAESASSFCHAGSVVLATLDGGLVWVDVSGQVVARAEPAGGPGRRPLRALSVSSDGQSVVSLDRQGKLERRVLIATGAAQPSFHFGAPQPIAIIPDAADVLALPEATWIGGEWIAEPDPTATALVVDRAVHSWLAQDDAGRPRIQTIAAEPGTCGVWYDHPITASGPGAPSILRPLGCVGDGLWAGAIGDSTSVVVGRVNGRTRVERYDHALRRHHPPELSIDQDPDHVVFRNQPGEVLLVTEGSDRAVRIRYHRGRLRSDELPWPSKLIAQAVVALNDREWLAIASRRAVVIAPDGEMRGVLADGIEFSGGVAAVTCPARSE